MTRRVARRSPARGGGRAHRRVELLQWRRSIGPSRPRRVVRRCPGHQPAGDRCGRRGLGRTLSCGPRSRRVRGPPAEVQRPAAVRHRWRGDLDRFRSARCRLDRPGALRRLDLADAPGRDGRHGPGRRRTAWLGSLRGADTADPLGVDGRRPFVLRPSSVGEGVTSGRRTPTRRSIREGTPFSCGSRRSRIQTFVGAGADARCVVGGMIRSSTRRGGTSEGDEVRHG